MGSLSNQVFTGLVITGILLFNPYLLKGQDRERKGYVAVGAGPTWLPGSDYESGVGLQLTLLECGYEFGHGFGVAATWAGGAFIYDGPATVFNGSTTQSIPAQFSVGYGIIALGPMYSIHFDNVSSLDFKA